MEADFSTEGAPYFKAETVQKVLELHWDDDKKTKSTTRRRRRRRRRRPRPVDTSSLYQNTGPYAPCVGVGLTAVARLVGGAM